MKVRTNFISNSSSSSFVIKVINNEKSKKCPACGRSDPNIVDLLKDYSNRGISDETEIHHNKEGLLSTLKKELNLCRERKLNYSRDHLPEEIDRWGTTYGKKLEWVNADITELEYSISIIENTPEEIYYLSIGYHDNLVQEIFDRQVADGSIEILKDIKTS